MAPVGGLPGLSAGAASAPRRGAGGFATRRGGRERPVVALAVGDRVTHDSFGLGRVVGVKGSGDSAEATIDFGDPKPKRLLLRYAPVEKL